MKSSPQSKEPSRPPTNDQDLCPLNHSRRCCGPAETPAPREELRKRIGKEAALGLAPDRECAVPNDRDAGSAQDSGIADQVSRDNLLIPIQSDARTIGNVKHPILHLIRLL